MSHPLVTIRFRPNAAVPDIERHWYHVPRIGDLVALREGRGIVGEVRWTEDEVEVGLYHWTDTPKDVG